MSCSLPEAQALIKAGRLKTLALMADKRAALFPDVPTLQEATGSPWKKGVWRGMVGPKGLPRDIAARYEAAFKKIMTANSFRTS